MAIARDPVLEELRRSASLSASTSRKTSMGLAAADSTISLEGLEQADIDALVNRRWQIEEIIGLIRSRIAILSGGRDRRGAPIITIHGSEHSDFRPSNLAKLLSYLSKVADERLQGLGFTVVLDMRQTSWVVMKKALKSLQLTFVEHVHRVLLIKPRAFWQRQRAGVSFTLKKAKFNYPIVMLESSTDLFHHLQVSQVTRDLGGTLDYEHDQWIQIQRNLEKHQIELEGRLEEFEVLRDQLGQLEHLENLNEARDAVRRHVEAKQRLDKGELDTLCERVVHIIAKMQPCDNPDFQACFGRLEDHCTNLQVTRGRLERLWEEKGSQLDKILQLRVFEHDSEQLHQWIRHEAGSLAYNHTDIGDTLSTAELRRQAFEDFRTRMKMKHHELSRVCTMGERLTAANHYAMDVFKSHSKELKGSWENLSQMADERATLLSLSVSFHDRQQKFFQKVEGWLDDCMEKHFPEDVEKAESLLSRHGQLKETYQELYASARQDGHKIIDRLKRPVGEGSLPTPFVIGTRHVKEILESLFDERNWLDEQWQRRQLILNQALNLRKYQKEANKVYTWLSDVGNPFLSSSNTIGNDANGARMLLRSHDQFEGDAHETYSLASQLFARGKELSASGECNPDMIEEEAESLETAVSIFATRLDERREIILHSQEYHNKMKALTEEFARLSSPVPHGQFNGSTSDVEPRLSSFLASWSKVCSKSSVVFECCQDLVKRLKDAEKSAKSARSSVNYSSAEESIEHRLEEGKAVEWKVREICLKREKRWKLTLQFNQLGPNVDKYLIELESWTQEQERVEWEPAENTMDAQLHLDAFQRQYDTLLSSHDELVATGRSISKEIEQLDLEMFGSTATGHAHPLTSKVEQLIERMKSSLEIMLRVASPKLQKLKDCLQYHLLQQRANKLTMALTTLSFSLSNLNGVGHTLDSARSLNQQASEINDKLKGVGSDVDGFSHEVEDSISRQHYQAAHLGKLARTLQEKKGAISRHAMERHKVISASVEFQQNVKNLSASMDNCHAQFSSKETGSSVADNQRMVKNLEELKTFIEQAAEEVRSLGKKLLELIIQTASTKTFSPWQSPKDGRRVHNSEAVMTLNRTPKSRRKNVSSVEISGSPKLNRVVTAESANRLLNGNGEDDGSPARPLARASSLDLLSDSVPEDSDAASGVASRLDCPHSPRLLVTPRKKTGVKSLSPSNHDQLMIEGVLHQMGRRLEELKEMWGKRQRRLKQSQKVVEFREAVPTVTEWVEQVGNKFLRGKHKHNLGRSIEEVKSLMVEGEQFEQKEVVVMSEKVRQLQSLYKSVEEAGSHAFLNELRALNASLINKWEEFETSLAAHMSNLDLSLKFQETLFEASNWCQKSQSFLNSMEEKGDVCDRSEEVASLVAELSVFINATKTEQMDRVAKLKETSEYLRSNLLSEVAQQIALSTERTIGDYDSTKASLEKLHSKLVQIEGEKDRERRLTKQRERVIEEILHTEETYAADLKLVVEKCRPRFVSELLPPSLKGKENIIFTNITDIEAFHRIHMLPRLQSLGTDVDGVAELFVENADQLTALYVPFCRDKSAADDLLTSHRSYFDRIQFMFGTSTPLHSLLIKPVQRIAKYPLLMKEALKYTTELNQTSKKLEEAVKAVEKILTVTNNAIHISCLENSKYLVRDLGQLLYQSTLLVSEQSRFGIKGEKERHVFAFDRALLFARKVELGQGAKFKYEHKFNIPLNRSVKVIEFVEGERCKFILTSGDQRLHFKASSLDIKQEWVTALRTAILADGHTKRNTTKNSNNSNMAVTLTPHPPGQENGWTRDLRTPSPSPSATEVNAAAAATKSDFGRCQVTEDYHSSGSYSSGSGHMTFFLSKGDIIEVLDNSIEGKWYVRTLGGSQHGWVPSSLLEHIPLDESNGEDMTDGKGGQWVQVARGPLTSGAPSDGEEKAFRVKPNQTSFGSRDIQSQNIISTLKKVTFEDSGKKEDSGPMNGVVEVVAEENEEEESSLDRPVIQERKDRSHTLPTLMPGSSSLDVPPSPSHSINSRGSPRASPRGSPRASPRGSPMSQRRHSELGSQPSFGSGSDKEKSPTHLNWTKSQWRRKVIRKRQGSTCRSSSVSSDRSESPGEKMLHSSSSDEAISSKSGKQPSAMDEGVSPRVSIEIEEEEAERIRKAQLKIRFIMTELVETERQYVKQLEECITCFIGEMQSPSLPDALKGKEKLVFGNIQAIYEFHHSTFLQLVEGAKDSVADMGKCFLDQAVSFEVYVPYCENKPKSESFLWTYAHSGGNFFAEVQSKHELRQGIDSYLIKPVQRITKYQLLLRDLKKSGEKAGMDTGNLEKALQLMQDIPKRANDAMALSMIFGYEGNIHANGQIILQDEFTVYERSRWTAARRHIFLLDQRLIITKEKDSDGMYVYKDSLKVHSLSVAEKEGDNPCRFAVGTGPIGKIDSWDQYYILEASSPEKKKEWVDALKDILKGQFELLKGLKVSTPQTRPRSKTFDSTSSYPTPESESAAMINISDDSENEDDEFMPTPKSSKATSPGPWTFATPPAGTAPRRQTVGEVTPHTPLTQTHSYNLYVVAEDCAPPKDNEGILYVCKGQIYDIIDNKSDWWWARLVRDLTSQSDHLCQQGWVPGSFLEKYKGSLTGDEQTNINTILRRKKLMKQVASVLGPTGGSAMPNGSAVGGMGMGSPGTPRYKTPAAKSHNKPEKNKLTITTSMTFQESDGEEEEAEQGEGLVDSNQSGTQRKQKAPHIMTHLSSETVIAGRSVQLKCMINSDANPSPIMEWSKDSLPLNIDRAFTSLGEESCVLRINMVERSDEGMYTCTIVNKKGVVSSSAKVTVMSPPDPPSKPLARPLTSTSVRLSWTPPTFVGHSPVTIYLVECKDIVSDRWSTIMKRITEPSTIVDDLMPGTEYVFRVLAGNQIGSSEPSEESDPFQMPRSPLDTEFSLDPFDSHYDLQGEIGRGCYGRVYECVHNTTQQMYAAKLLPLDVGRDHAQHELKMLSRVSHPNIVQITSAYLTQQHFVLLFQLIQGVNIFEYFTHRDCLTEPCAAACLEQVVSALCYLHQSNIAHLDIKPEHLLAVEVEGGYTVPEIKLIHFERSREVNSDSDVIIKRLDDHIEYEAPEILLGEPVSTATDMWSLGVLLYTLLGGSSPFLVDSLDLTKDNIINVRFSFPVKSFREVSEGAKQLCSQLMVREKSKRLSSLQCLRHSWLDNNKFNDQMTKLNVSRLKSYVSSRKWQSSLFLEQSQL